MKQIIFLLCTGFLILFISSNVFGQMVDNQLGKELSRIFPELQKGYIDLNNNKKMDRLDDADEIIPESRVKDSIIQVQEVLDFISNYYMYIPMDKILSVQKSLEQAKGAIPEIISLSYMESMNEIIRKREELGADTLFLTPSSLKEANSQMEEFIASMTAAYKKERRSDESEFIKSRDQLFSMIEKGYPLPEALSEEERGILISSMINTIIKEKVSNPRLVKIAVKTLGKLKAAAAVHYIMDLMDSPEYKTDCIQALGDIGNKDALNILTRELENVSNANIQNSIIKSLGEIGSEDSLNILTDILNPSDDLIIPQKTIKSVITALSKLASKGTTDSSISAILMKYSKSEDISLKIAAIEGLSSFNNPATAAYLLGMLKTEKDEEVKLKIIKTLSLLSNNSIIPTFIVILRGKNTTDTIKKSVIEALGTKKDGVKGIIDIMKNLGSTNKDVRKAASNAVLKLYKVNSKTVIGSLSRGIITSKDIIYQTEGTAILAILSDPDSVNALSSLLQSPYPEVKKNVTWALYKIRTGANPKIADNLKKLVISETEPLDVRINSVRALGSMKIDSPVLNIWQTLLTTAKMRGEKYTMLRFFAIKALGDLGTINDEIIKDLLKIAAREPDILLRKEALNSIKDLACTGSEEKKSLLTLFRREKDPEIRIAVIEILGDMGSKEVAELAPSLLADSTSGSDKKRIIYALSKTRCTEALSVILDISDNRDIQDFIISTLKDADLEIINSLITKRLKTETNSEIESVMESIQAGFEESF